VDYSALSPPELFSVCANGGDPASWEEFIRRFNAVIGRSIFRVVIRNGRSDNSLIDDLIQDTYLKICANDCRLLRTFTPRHADSTFAYLKVVAASVAYDYFKSRHAEKREPESKSEVLDDATALSSSVSSQNSLNPAERAILIDQIDRKLVAVVPASELRRARVVFWLYYRSGFTARAIASLPAVGLSTEGVESLLLRLTRLVRDSLSHLAARDPSSGKGFQQAESF
jgi:DNA-directed RNA polymerase specialized sigma24 family protein